MQAKAQQRIFFSRLIRWRYLCESSYFYSLPPCCCWFFFCLLFYNFSFFFFILFFLGLDVIPCRNEGCFSELLGHVYDLTVVTPTPFLAYFVRRVSVVKKLGKKKLYNNKERDEKKRKILLRKIEWKNKRNIKREIHKLTFF